MGLNFEQTKHDNFLEFSLSGKILDKDQAQPLVTEIESNLENGENKIILNLTDLEYMNSSGLNSFISILTKARTAGGEAVICCVNKKINELLLITKLNTVFTVVDSLEDARKKLIKE